MSMLKVRNKQCLMGIQNFVISGRKWPMFGNEVRSYFIGWLISGLLYDHFKHGFKSITAKGTKL
jgi:hypothetical protein